MDIKAFIDRSEYFTGITQASKELLADICIPKNLKKKEVLFREGDKGYTFYFLASGAVGIYKGMRDGREVVIKMIQPGEPFAEVILFEQDRFPASAIALKPSMVFALGREQFYSLLGREDFRKDFISMLMRKQRYLAERIKYLTMHDVEERFFLFLKEQFGEREKITPSIPKKDIAAAIGTTPETYSRLINRLTEEHTIGIEGKTIVLMKDFWKQWNNKQEHL